MSADDSVVLSQRKLRTFPDDIPHDAASVYLDGNSLVTLAAVSPALPVDGITLIGHAQSHRLARRARQDGRVLVCQPTVRAGGMEDVTARQHPQQISVRVVGETDDAAARHATTLVRARLVAAVGALLAALLNDEARYARLPAKLARWQWHSA